MSSNQPIRNAPYHQAAAALQGVTSQRRNGNNAHTPIDLTNSHWETPYTAPHIIVDVRVIAPAMDKLEMPVALASAMWGLSPVHLAILSNTFVFKFVARQAVPNEVNKKYTRVAAFYLDSLKNSTNGSPQDFANLIGLRCSCCNTSPTYVKGSTNFVNLKHSRMVDSLLLALKGRLTHMISCSSVPEKTRGLLFGSTNNLREEQQFAKFAKNWVKVVIAQHFQALQVLKNGLPSKQKSRQIAQQLPKTQQQQQMLKASQFQNLAQFQEYHERRRVLQEMERMKRVQQQPQQQNNALLPQQQQQQQQKARLPVPTIPPTQHETDWSLLNLEIIEIAQDAEENLFDHLNGAIAWATQHTSKSSFTYPDLSEELSLLFKTNTSMMELFMQHYQMHVTKTMAHDGWEAFVRCSHCHKRQKLDLTIWNDDQMDHETTVIQDFVIAHSQSCRSIPPMVKRTFQRQASRSKSMSLHHFCKLWQKHLKSLYQRCTEEASIARKLENDIFRPFTLDDIQMHGTIPFVKVLPLRNATATQMDSLKPKDVIVGNELYREAEGNKSFRSRICEIRPMYLQLTVHQQELVVDTLAECLVKEGFSIYTIKGDDGVLLGLDDEQRRAYIKRALDDGFPDMLRRPVDPDATSKLLEISYAPLLGVTNDGLCWGLGSNKPAPVFRLSDVKRARKKWQILPSPTPKDIDEAIEKMKSEPVLEPVVMEEEEDEPMECSPTPDAAGAKELTTGIGSSNNSPTISNKIDPTRSSENSPKPQSDTSVVPQPPTPEDTGNSNGSTDTEDLTLPMNGNEARSNNNQQLEAPEHSTIGCETIELAAKGADSSDGNGSKEVIDNATRLNQDAPVQDEQAQPQELAHGHNGGNGQKGTDNDGLSSNQHQPDMSRAQEDAQGGVVEPTPENVSPEVLYDTHKENRRTSMDIDGQTTNTPSDPISQSDTETEDEKYDKSDDTTSEKNHHAVSDTKSDEMVHKSSDTHLDDKADYPSSTFETDFDAGKNEHYDEVNHKDTGDTPQNLSASSQTRALLAPDGVTEARESTCSEALGSTEVANESRTVNLSEGDISSSTRTQRDKYQFSNEVEDRYSARITPENTDLDKDGANPTTNLNKEYQGYRATSSDTEVSVDRSDDDAIVVDNTETEGKVREIDTEKVTLHQDPQDAAKLVESEDTGPTTTNSDGEKHGNSKTVEIIGVSAGAKKQSDNSPSHPAWLTLLGLSNGSARMGTQASEKVGDTSHSIFHKTRHSNGSDAGLGLSEKADVVIDPSRLEGNDSAEPPRSPKKSNGQKINDELNSVIGNGASKALLQPMESPDSTKRKFDDGQGSPSKRQRAEDTSSYPVSIPDATST